MKVKKWIVLSVCVLLLVLADQGTKLWAIRTLSGGRDIAVIPGVFEFSYVENRGAAFGILQNQRWIFLIATLVISLLLLRLYITLPKEKMYHPVRFSLLLILSGAVGNMIDRVGRRYVVDFLYFKLIDFPVFNLADCYVVTGVFLLAVLLLTHRDMLDRIFHKGAV